MAEAKEPEAKVETKKIKLDVPFMTNGKVFFGEVELPVDVAEDLERRQKEYDQDQKRLLHNNGETIDALDGDTLKG